MFFQIKNSFWLSKSNHNPNFLSQLFRYSTPLYIYIYIYIKSALYLFCFFAIYHQIQYIMIKISKSRLFMCVNTVVIYQNLYVLGLGLNPFAPYCIANHSRQFSSLSSLFFLCLLIFPLFAVFFLKII